ncbi:saframycin Mx1 synthetase B [Legionella busanensis]|uniref:Saframycin Mx1 synthetase B n=1 Tax=Legionella busanensis TaxID=190655 RepID=A0A378JL84_9GAMM|nr:acyl carrier protein [Legionella busanensis]STX52096.1 saframycin Mx1 synthetase B [Legionella busanensis]
MIKAIREQVLQDHSLSVYQIALIPQRSLPKTTSGKIRRKVIQKNLEEKNFEYKILWRDNKIDQDQISSDIENTENAIKCSLSIFDKQFRDKIHEELSNILDIEVDSIDDDKNFAEFGLDSLMAVELEARLQDYLKETCPLPAATVINHPTINLLISHIKKIRKSID